MSPNVESRGAARRSGLRYATDQRTGITRRRAGSGWAFYAPGGRRIARADVRRRLLRLAIPPAWTQVWISPDPKGHLQVTARDARGRKQYRYHPAYRASREQAKFERILAFSHVLPRIRARVERDLGAASLSRRQVLATIVRLLDLTFLRIGNDEYTRQNQSYGLTTLTERHVSVRGGTLRFSFRGKSGVARVVTLTNRRLARIIGRMQDLPGQELFRYLDATGHPRRITSDDVNRYLRAIAEADVTAKDFRTWAGTVLAARALHDSGVAETATDARSRVNQALDLVAGRLGNTRAVCRQYYVHPVILESYLDGVLVPLPVSGAGTIADGDMQGLLQRDERAVLGFLTERCGGAAPAAPSRRRRARGTGDRALR